MKYLFSSLIAATLVLVSFCASAQSSPTPARAHADSLQRVLLQDSLGLSSTAASQFLALRDSSIVRADRLQASATLTPQQLSEQLQAMRREIIESMRTLIGTLNYNRYLELLGRQ